MQRRDTHRSGACSTRTASLARAALAALSLVLLLSAAGCANLAVMEQELSKTNTQTELAFEETAFNKHNVDEAFAHYVGPGFLQHETALAGALPDDRNGALRAYRVLLEQRFPRSRLSVERTIAQRDMVATQSLWTRAPRTHAIAVVDIYRVRDGRIVEHWAVLSGSRAEGAKATR
jgi:predicted SnoaL-like aldol condensation-catalyzing enzyme